MSAIRTHALRLLRDHIAEQIPELKGKICAGPTEAPHVRNWPHLSIVPAGKFTYHPDQADVHKFLGKSRALMNVGRFEGVTQLRLGATTADKRAELEEKVFALFLETPGQPGILYAEITDCHDALVAWELLDDGWENEAAFAKKWFSVLALTTQIPALVERGSVYTIDDLRLSLTDDLTTDYDSLPASSLENVSIDEDGTLIPL